jgi:predicted GIY-YIG superfamily endonuclease
VCVGGGCVGNTYKRRKKTRVYIMKKSMSVETHPEPHTIGRTPVERKRVREATSMLRRSEMLMEPFVRYWKSIFKSNSDHTKEWEMERIKADMPLWAVKLTWIKVYIMMNTSSRYSKICYVGSSEDLDARINQHNGYRKGGPSETRKAMGTWRLVFYCELPPIRNFRACDIVEECSNVRGGPPAKIIKAIDAATSRSVKYKISRNLVQHGSVFYLERVADHIKGLCHTDEDIYF